MFFGSELHLSLYFPVLLLGTRYLEIKALGRALEVVEVDVLGDDALSDLGGRAAEPLAWWPESQSYPQGDLCRLPDHV